MRRHLIILVLTTGTFVLTDATRLSTPTGDKDSALPQRRHPGPASGLDVPDRRTWTSRSALENGFIKRDGKYRYTIKDKRKKGDGDSDDDDDDDDDDGGYEDHNDDRRPDQTPQPLPDGDPQYTNTLTSSTSTLTTSMTTTTNPPSTVSSSTTPAVTPSPSQPTGPKTGISDGNGAGPLNSTDPDDGGGNNNNGQAVNAAAISGGIVGGLLLILILLLIWYWFVVRPGRRERLMGQQAVLPKDSDLESHVTVDLRNGPGSSSDGLSSHIMSTGTLGHVPSQGQHVIVESAARSLSIPPSPQAEPYTAVNRASPTMNQTSFMEAYAAPHMTYNQDHAQSYPSMENPQGVVPPVFPSQGHPLPLQIAAFPKHSNTTMELDGRPPPPRYPDAIAASQVPGPSPTSPLPVSPLSAISPTALTTDETQYSMSSYQGPRQPSYGDYEPSSLPEVVSPICQLGQTSASLPEYDESAEAARSGMGNHNNLVSQHHLHGGDEKQALSSQQPMPRY